MWKMGGRRATLRAVDGINQVPSCLSFSSRYFALSEKTRSAKVCSTSLQRCEVLLSCPSVFTSVPYPDYKFKPDFLCTMSRWWPQLNCIFLETAYKATAYRVNSAIKLQYPNPNMPLKRKVWLVIKLICIESHFNRDKLQLYNRFPVYFVARWHFQILDFPTKLLTNSELREKYAPEWQS